MTFKMKHKFKIYFLFLIITLTFMYDRSFSQTDSSGSLNLKMSYDLNIPIFGAFEDISFSSFYLTPSYQYKRNEFYCGPLLGRREKPGNNPTSYLLMGCDVGYNYFLLKDPDIFLFYSLQFVRHAGNNYQFITGAYTPYTNTEKWKENLLCGNIGSGIKINLGKKKKTYFFITLGYSIIHRDMKGWENGVLYTGVNYPKFLWSHVDISMGINIRLKTFNNK